MNEIAASAPVVETMTIVCVVGEGGSRTVGKL